MLWGGRGKKGRGEKEERKRKRKKKRQGRTTGRAVEHIKLYLFLDSEILSNLEERDPS
jgi:hypothetical protein